MERLKEIILAKKKVKKRNPMWAEIEESCCGIDPARGRDYGVVGKGEKFIVMGINSDDEILTKKVKRTKKI